MNIKRCPPPRDLGGYGVQAVVPEHGILRRTFLSIAEHRRCLGAVLVSFGPSNARRSAGAPN